MAEAEWQQSTLRAFGLRLCGEAMDHVNERGEPITDDTLLVLLNAKPESVEFVLPAAHPGAGGKWWSTQLGRERRRRHHASTRGRVWRSWAERFRCRGPGGPDPEARGG